MHAVGFVVIYIYRVPQQIWTLAWRAVHATGIHGIAKADLPKLVVFTTVEFGRIQPLYRGFMLHLDGPQGGILFDFFAAHILILHLILNIKAILLGFAEVLRGILAIQELKGIIEQGAFLLLGGILWKLMRFENGRKAGHDQLGQISKLVGIADEHDLAPGTALSQVVTGLVRVHADLNYSII